MIMPKKSRPSIAVYNIIVLVTVTTTTTSLLPLVKADDYVCDLVDCVNGMFSQTKCACDCIPPFCPDEHGDCIVAGTCDDPWEGCEMGENCPWWDNPSKAESCDTGPLVPEGIWDIFPTEKICCQAKHPYSTTCNVPPETAPPTKYPTIALVEDDEEIVPIQFSASGVQSNGAVSISEISDEMEIVLKRILLRLAEKIDGLKVMKVESILSPLHRILWRVLEEEVILYFHVYVVRSDEKQFGPYIIQGIRDSYNEVLSEIQTYSDTKQLTGDFVINFCTERNGLYDLCVIDDTMAPQPSPKQRDPFLEEPYYEEEEDGRRLAGWAVALIVILVLSLVCCAGYAVAVLCFGVANCFKRRDNSKGKEFQNNIYMDGIESRGPTDYERRLAIMDDRSRNSERPLAITQGESRTSRASTYCEDPMNDASFHFHDSFTINSNKRSRPSRDPTMYIPGQEGKPDPTDSHHSSVRTIDTNGTRRYYAEEPPVKPKREPTMYVDGKVSDYMPTKYQTYVEYDDEYSDLDNDEDDEVYNEHYYRGERDKGGGTNSKKSNQHVRSSAHHNHPRSQHDQASLASRSQFSSQKSRKSSVASQKNYVYSS